MTAVASMDRHLSDAGPPAWDGRGRNPAELEPKRRADRSSDLSRVEIKDAAHVKAEAREADAEIASDNRLTKALVICSGCLSTVALDSRLDIPAANDPKPLLSRLGVSGSP